MRNLQGSSSSYQKPQELTSPNDDVNGGEYGFYKLIHSKKNMAILSAATNLSERVIETIVQETINTLQSKNLIKEEFQLPEKIISEMASPLAASATSYNATLETREVYDLIKKKKNMGIKIGDMIRETNLSETVVRESIKILLAKKIIRVAVNPYSGENCLTLKEYELAKEVLDFQPYSTGGRSRYYDNLGRIFPYQETKLYYQKAPVGFARL